MEYILIPPAFPPDYGILLRDILEDEVDEKYYLSDKIIKSLSSRPQGYQFKVTDGRYKSGCIRKDVAKMGTTDTYVCAAMRGRPNAIGENVQQLEPNQDGKTNTLTSVAKDNLVIQLNTSKESGGVREIKSGKAGAIPARAREDGSGQNVVLSGTRIRRLTPTECSRLQTIPKWYRWECSETQQYKMLGNGWTIVVIVWILSFINREKYAPMFEAFMERMKTWLNIYKM